MKFREMSWEELKADFRKKLDKYTTKELVKSLEKYKIKTDEYTINRNINMSNKIFNVPFIVETNVNGTINFEYENINRLKEQGENVIWKNKKKLKVA